MESDTSPAGSIEPYARHVRSIEPRGAIHAYRSGLRMTGYDGTAGIAAGMGENMSLASAETGTQFMARRGISPEVLDQMRVTIGRVSDDRKGVTPDPEGRVIAFPYFEAGQVVAEKFRSTDKKFWQRPGGRRTFYNADVLINPDVLAGRAVVITEGEMDALTAIECGYPYAVSVPDGAPPPRNGKPIEDDDSTGKFEFMWNNRERLKHVKQFILAVDNDEPGQQLAKELMRLLMPSRCSFVTYPDRCKDLNDVLMKYGHDAVADVIGNATPYPIPGVHKYSDYPNLGRRKTYSTGWPTLDSHLKLFPGEFMVVTGVPSHGKSTWVINLLCQMASNWGWRACLFSPEMPPEDMAEKFLRILGPSAGDFVDRYFCCIDTDRVDEQDTVFNLEWIIDRAEDCVNKYGINVLVIDPWNEVEHSRDRNEMLTDYVGRSIRALKRFGRLRNVAVIVVAHPTKDVLLKGVVRTPSLYDIEGSAHWFNKCDHGVIIHRGEDGTSEVTVAKSRFEHAGERGVVKMRFDKFTCRYEMLAPLEEGQ